MTLLERCEDLERFASTVCDRVRAGDESLLEELIRRRETLVTLVRAHAGAIDPRAARAVQRAVALDRELSALLETRRAALARALGTVVKLRHTLARYRGEPVPAAMYVERVV